ncbi:TerC family protein [Bacillus inaquosorum]|uniref:TerC family protein n=1 Tax=Bacillus inaquosorum TaxID=483913 RepID=UPI0022824D87|nr:TerC family protein [Bacillus inaquosorum]MCY8795092.1 TerC family protein [Bacillus inaquosorum]MEC0771600.1 TerC family protein [Bacillus inaquosorum]MEC0795138.1 TerC family protein [Bacillus inaquosorum]
MDFLHHIMSTYASFFDWKMWGEVLSDPVSWGLIGSLVVLEGLLSADNALVLAVMVKHLPEKQRKKALTYGLFGAYIFRFIFIGLGMLLIKFWWIKVLGALYLTWLVIKHFWIGEKEEEADGIKKNSWMVRTFGIFWATVISVELMDLAFSVDSILAAFAVSEKVWVLLIGGMLGILMMRTVAKVFLVLIDKIPELENTAFVLIGIIALKMAASAFHYEMPHSVFFIIIIAAFAVTFIIHYINKQKQVREQTAASKEE